MPQPGPSAGPGQQRSLVELMELDCDHAATCIVDFIASRVRQERRDGICLGLSGGVDSAVVAALAVRAVRDPSQVHCLYLYDRDSAARLRGRAAQLAVDLRASFVEYDISALAGARGAYRAPVVKLLGFSSTLNRTALRVLRTIRAQDSAAMDDRAGRPASPSPLVRVVRRVAGLATPSRPVRQIFDSFSIRHVVRREILESYASERNLELLGAANRIELFLGWFVKGGVDDLLVEPLLGLYKGQVRQLARHLGLPKEIVEQPPSTDMLKGLGDEDMLGCSYDRLDQVAYAVEHGLGEEELLRAGITQRDLQRGLWRHHAMREKRRGTHLYPDLRVDRSRA